MLKRTIFAGAFLVGTAMAASAADLPVAPPPPPMATPAFDWSGIYIGVYGGAFFVPAAASPIPPIPRVGLQAGYNFVRGGFLAGIEIQAGIAGFSTPLVFEGNLNARLGYILGERFLVYGEAGVGMFAPGAPVPLTSPFWTAGGGVEVAFGRALSVFAEGKVLSLFGTPGIAAYVVQGGLNWNR